MNQIKWTDQNDWLFFFSFLKIFEDIYRIKPESSTHNKPENLLTFTNWTNISFIVKFCVKSINKFINYITIFLKANLKYNTQIIFSFSFWTSQIIIFYSEVEPIIRFCSCLIAYEKVIVRTNKNTWYSSLKLITIQNNCM